MLIVWAFGSIPQQVAATYFVERGQWTFIPAAGLLEQSKLTFVDFVGFYLAYMCWFTLLKQCRMDEAAPFILLMPVVGIVTAYGLLGETISAAQIIGGLVILAGLAVVSGLGLPRGKKGRVQDPAPLTAD